MYLYLNCVVYYDVLFENVMWHWLKEYLTSGFYNYTELSKNIRYVNKNLFYKVYCNVSVGLKSKWFKNDSRKKNNNTKASLLENLLTISGILKENQKWDNKHWC